MRTAGLDRRARTREKKTAALLDAAISIVEDGGMDALTIQRLAQKMDWAVGALYRYFPSKDALLAELQCRVISELKVSLFNKLEDYRSESTLFRLSLTAWHYQAFLLQRPSHFRLIAVALGDPKQYLPDDLGLRVMQEVHSILLRISALLLESSTEQELNEGDIHDRTLVFWSSVQGIMQLNKLRRFAPDTIDTNRLTKTALQTLFCGWGANNESLPNIINAAHEAVK